MNLFLDYRNKILYHLKNLNDEKIIILPNNFNNLTVELPPKNQKSDLSCNGALVLANFNNKPPMDLASVLKTTLLKKFKEFKEIEIAKPGFLNISLKDDFWKTYLQKLIKLKLKYGAALNLRKKYNIEYVSANPTGPLHVGHCRGAILGDVISNLLIFNGNTVTREYYINDHGGQIKNFVHSVYYRILEIKKKKGFPKDHNLYPGNYIIDIAKQIIKNKSIKDFNNLEKIFPKLSLESIKCSMQIIKKNLKLIGVEHDLFINESKLIKTKYVLKAVNLLKKNNYIYDGFLPNPKGDTSDNWKKRNQILFKSTEFGDDTDRALQRSDGSWSYFAGDIAYHAHKLKRNYDHLINILGADHAGYIKRITAAVKALSNNKSNLTCKVSQLVKLLKNNQPLKMSKRSGDYITVEDLVKEVGKDATRFMMLSRSNDVELDFDFEKVTEKSKDNPVFYVQYAYARINSVFRNIKLDINKEVKLPKKIFSINQHEKEIVKKISEWPKCVEISINKLEPHRIPYYLYELATLFHSYWNLGKEKPELRFINADKKYNSSRLLILQCIAIVIRNGMSILGVNTPKRM